MHYNIKLIYFHKGNILLFMEFLFYVKGEYHPYLPDDLNHWSFSGEQASEWAIALIIKDKAPKKD